ncbi:hypothetical protein HQ571_06390 [Candidatus Kuenenbacteria bacterium]|nr:hypothetical protein [Candidatus Kuenenbacteria bacterium]
MVKSKFWPLIFILVFLLCVALAPVITFFLVMSKLNPLLSFLLSLIPTILWIIYAKHLVKKKGTHEQKEIQKTTGSYGYTSFIGFVASFFMTIVGALKGYTLLLIFAPIIFYGLWFISWTSIRTSAVKNNIQISWKRIWLMTGMILVLVFGGQSVNYFIFDKSATSIVFLIIFGGIGIIFSIWRKKLAKSDLKSKVYFTVLNHLAWNLGLFLAMTVLFSIFFLAYLKN